MKSTKMLTIAALILMAWLAGFSNAAKMGTAWTYQGRLIDANYPADGLYDFQFRLYDADVGGAQQSSTIDIKDLDVIDGYFTVELDFGSDVFNGDARWLETDVRPGVSLDANDFVTLTPRTEVTPLPYALQTRGIFVDKAGNVGIGNTSPASLLDVEGQITATALKGQDSILHIESSSDIEFMMDSDDNPSLFAFFELFNGKGTNLWYVNESGTMRVSGDSFLLGNVGIGKATGIITAKLEVLQSTWEDIVKIGADFSDNRLIFSSGNSWASISGSTTNRDDITILHSNGNVGIGTTSPSSRLHIGDNTSGDLIMKIHNLNNTGTERLYFGTSTGSDAGMIVWGSSSASYPGKWRFLNNKTSGHYDWLTSGSVKMTLDNSGNLGIGTQSPTGKLDVQNSSELSAAEIRNSRNSGVAYGVNVLANGSGGTNHYAGRFSASGATNNYSIYADGIDSKSYFGGNVGIETMYPSYTLHVVGSAAKTVGGIYWTNISDRNLKEDIKPLEGALDRLTKLQGRTFKWKDAAELNAEEGTHIGLVAQEVEEVFPQWVSEDNQGRKQVALEGLEAVTIEAIKELKAENESLKKRLEILEKKLNAQ